MAKEYITSAVGAQKPNAPENVMVVQKLLNNHSHLTHIRLLADGNCGPRTISAILAFQRKALAMHLPDGVVDVKGLTLERLNSSTVAMHTRRSAAHSKSATSDGLTDADYQAAATRLGCEAAAVKAVAETETGDQGAFDAQGRPTILFERHIFSELTQHKYDKDPNYKDISNPKQGGYGLFSAQYPKLERAEILDKDAALQSASWGRFQLVGKYYSESGYDSVETFVAGMQKSSQEQLNAFVNKVLAMPQRQKALKEKNWENFAYYYNGAYWRSINPDYATNMKDAYAKYSK
jgi:hypothetical protein